MYYVLCIEKYVYIYILYIKHGILWIIDYIKYPIMCIYIYIMLYIHISNVSQCHGTSMPASLIPAASTGWNSSTVQELRIPGTRPAGIRVAPLQEMGKIGTSAQGLENLKK